MPPSPLSDDEARAFEQKCADEVRRCLETSELRMSHVSNRVLVGVELQGARPETEIVVRYREGGGPVQRESFALWRGEFASQDPSDPQEPTQIALLIAVNASDL